MPPNHTQVVTRRWLRAWKGPDGSLTGMSSRSSSSMSKSPATLRGHAPALEYLVEAKERGLVEAVGISTHTVAGVRAAAAHPQIEIISP